MKNLSSHILTFLTVSSIYSSVDAFSFNDLFKQTKEKMASLFGSNTKKQIIQKDITRTTQKILIVENLQGTIKIKTDWNQNIISMTAIKKATEENLAKITIDIDTSKTDSIRMKTIFHDESVKGSVDYTLIIPKQMTVNLKTPKGNIRVKRFDGEVRAHTGDGNIEIANVSKKVVAEVDDTGNIIIDQSQGTIEATTAAGNIQINNAKNSIAATTNYGDIVVQANSLPPTGSLQLNATGALYVYLPENINAHVRAQASRGKVFSEHYITLASQTTKLNTQAWAQLQRCVEGSIGTGEADISLQSSSGSIRILNDSVA